MVSIAAVLSTSPALADDEHPETKAGGPGTPLGEQGQIAVSSDMLVNISYTKTSVPTGTNSPDAIISLMLAPAADYFLLPRVSVGAAAQLSYESQGDISARGIGAAPRLGYLMPLADRLSFWPKVSINFLQVTEKQPAQTSTGGVDALGGSSEISYKKSQLGLFAPLLYQPADHFFLGGGPVLTMDLYSRYGHIKGNKETTIGLLSVVGGYF